MNNRDVLTALNKKVYGHERAKKTLITLVRRSYTSYLKRFIEDDREETIKPLNCVLIGDSGTGKTQLIEELSKLMDFPLLKIDATNLSPTGNSDGLNGTRLKQQLVALAKSFVETRDNYHSTEGTLARTVVFVDEIDKLATSFDSSGNWNKHVQSNFLTLIDAKDEFAGVSWVFAGAFSSIERTTTKEALGFSSSKSVEHVKIDDEHLIKAGLIPELVGRVGSIVSLDTFTEGDYANILRTMLLPEKYSQLRRCSVSFEELTLEEIKEISQVSEQGIRGVRRKLDDRYIEDEFEAGSAPQLTFNRNYS